MKRSLERLEENYRNIQYDNILDDVNDLNEGDLKDCMAKYLTKIKNQTKREMGKHY